MYDVQRDGGRCEPLHQAAGFRLGVSDEESVRGPAQYSGFKVGRKATWVATRESSRPYRDENSFIFTVFSRLPDAQICPV